MDDETLTDTYSLFQSSNDVEAWVTSGSTIGAMSTIFKVTDEYGGVAFFKNMKSYITLGGRYKLRNMPGNGMADRLLCCQSPSLTSQTLIAFMNLVKVELRDAQYEVDALLNNLIHHQNTAPFIARKLIQYHGISNPR